MAKATTRSAATPTAKGGPAAKKAGAKKSAGNKAVAKKAATRGSAVKKAVSKPATASTAAGNKAVAKKTATKKSIGESRSKRPSTKREPQVDVLAQQAAAKAARADQAKQKPTRGKVEADDRSTRSSGRHSGAGDAEYVREKGDARRRDPDVNKNSQAQKDDVRDGQRDQSPHPNKRSDGQTQDGGARQAQASRSRPPQTIGPNRK